MKKNIILSLLIAVGFVFSTVSCSKKLEEKDLFDFGKATYNEPFVGLLKNRPNLLVKSLRWIPFSWFTSDTISLEKNYVLSFNEDCIRSKSEVVIQVRDSLYASFNGIQIYCNGKYIPDGEFKINADSLEKQVTLKCVLSPLLGDTIINGYVIVQGKELDAVNEEMLQQESNIIATWKCQQKIGRPWMIWLLWLIPLICAIVLLIIGIRYLIINYGYQYDIFEYKLGNTYIYAKRRKKKKDDNWRKRIKRRTNWSDEIINALRSEGEANVYIKAGLKEKKVGGRAALIQPNIDSNMEVPEWYITKMGESWRGWTNDDLMGEGYAPFTSPTKKGSEEETDPFELHHIGQHPDSPLAELTPRQHIENTKILHPSRKSKINRDVFAKEKKEYWKERRNLWYA